MQRARCSAARPSSLSHQWHQLTRPAIIKPGLRPSSKLLFGDKSILQSRADGHLAHCNRSLSLVSLQWSPATDVEPHQTCWLTRTASQTKLRHDSQPTIQESSPPRLLSNYYYYVSKNNWCWWCCLHNCALSLPLQTYKKQASQRDRNHYLSLLWDLFTCLPFLCFRVL